MDWLLIGTFALGLADALFAVALLRASDRLDVTEPETKALAELSRVESPSGRRFFPDEDAVWDLAETLEDPHWSEQTGLSGGLRRTLATDRTTRPRAGRRPPPGDG
jgi:hypothetical protein